MFRHPNPHLAPSLSVNNSRNDHCQNGEDKVSLVNAPAEHICWGIFTPDTLLRSVMEQVAFQVSLMDRLNLCKNLRRTT